MIFGVDVSQYQGTVDWPTVAASGLSFAIARVTRGLDIVDTRYPANRRAIPAAGLVPGAYHHLTPQPAAAQAEAFVQRADPQALHALDVEEAGLDVTGWIARYRTHYRSKVLVIYTGRDMWARAGQGTGAHLGPLWLAGHLPGRYVTATGTVQQQFAAVGSARGALPWGGWTAPVLMQFTDHAQVPGISGGVDGDAFFGTLAELRRLASDGVDLEAADVEAIAVRVRDRLLAVTYGADAAGQPFTLGRLWGEVRLSTATAAGHAAPDRLDALAGTVAAAVAHRLGLPAPTPGPTGPTGPPGGATPDDTPDTSRLARLIADEISARLRS